MCGLSGFAGINNKFSRFMLAINLGVGIDSRGGDAAGFVNIAKDSFRYCKKLGTWGESKSKFLHSASNGELCMMHSRYATCGMKTIQEAHPFAIKRNGKTVLWGAHNGIIPDAWDSAKENNRNIDVDSQELFELIADNEIEKMQELSGYGVITWIEASSPNKIKLARLSEDSEICMVELEDGGHVWASTPKILDNALKEANLNAVADIELDEIGRVYEISNEGIIASAITGVMVRSYYSRYSYLDLDDIDIVSQYGDAYEKELEQLFEKWEFERANSITLGA